MVHALTQAQKPAQKLYDDLSAYNTEISARIRTILGL